MALGTMRYPLAKALLDNLGSRFGDQLREYTSIGEADIVSQVRILRQVVDRLSEDEKNDLQGMWRTISGSIAGQFSGRSSFP